ncbi:MAG: GrpB family protein [Bacteroidetes bacterium]|nr:MAG: GrpB family protein [Bacteroidota bacterium]
MHIQITPFNTTWATQFSRIRDEIQNLLQEYDPEIEHIGSTSVPGLAAKPIIDIMAGIRNLSQLDALVPDLLENRHYLFYQAFNRFFPQRRLFVRLKDETDPAVFPQVFTELESIPHAAINPHRLAHVHVWEYESADWVRHIAFREYLKEHDVVREQYAALKIKLGKRDWKNGMEYNNAKDAFLKQEERNAISWYRQST